MKAIFFLLTRQGNDAKEEEEDEEEPDEDALNNHPQGGDGVGAPQLPPRLHRGPGVRGPGAGLHAPGLHPPDQPPDEYDTDQFNRGNQVSLTLFLSLKEGIAQTSQDTRLEEEKSTSTSMRGQSGQTEINKWNCTQRSVVRLLAGTSLFSCFAPKSCSKMINRGYNKRY